MISQRFIIIVVTLSLIVVAAFTIRAAVATTALSVNSVAQPLPFGPDRQQNMAQQTLTPRKMLSRSPSAPAWLRTTEHRVNRSSTRQSPSDRAGLRPMECLRASGRLPTSIPPVNP